MPKQLKLTNKQREQLRDFLKRGKVYIPQSTKKHLECRNQDLVHQYKDYPNLLPIWLASPFIKEYIKGYIIVNPTYIDGPLGQQCTVRIHFDGREIIRTALFYDEKPERVPGLEVCCWPRNLDGDEE